MFRHRNNSSINTTNKWFSVTWFLSPVTWLLSLSESSFSEVQLNCTDTRFSWTWNWTDFLPVVRTVPDSMTDKSFNNSVSDILLLECQKTIEIQTEILSHCFISYALHKRVFHHIVKLCSNIKLVLKSCPLYFFCKCECIWNQRVLPSHRDSPNIIKDSGWQSTFDAS